MPFIYADAAPPRRDADAADEHRPICRRFRRRREPPSREPSAIYLRHDAAAATFSADDETLRRHVYFA